MAIKIYEQFKPFANPADGDHPYGSFKNDSIPGAEDGTPLDAVWANDYAGFDAALFAQAGIVPSGHPDKLGASQRVEAIKRLSSNISGVEYTSVENMFAGNPLSIAVGDICRAGGMSFEKVDTTPIDENNYVVFDAINVAGFAGGKPDYDYETNTGTNNTAAIQKAFSYRNEGEIYIPPGHYLIDTLTLFQINALNDDPQLQLKISAYGAKFWSTATGADSGLVINQCKRLRIEGLQMASVDGANPTYLTSIRGMWFGHIEDCDLGDTSFGLTPSGGFNSHYYNHFDSVTMKSLTFGTGDFVERHVSQVNQFTNCLIGLGSDYALRVYGSRSINATKFVGCDLSYYSAGLIYIDEQCDGNIDFDSCYFDTSKGMPLDTKGLFLNTYGATQTPSSANINSFYLNTGSYIRASAHAGVNSGKREPMSCYNLIKNGSMRAAGSLGLTTGFFTVSDVLNNEGYFRRFKNFVSTSDNAYVDFTSIPVPFDGYYSLTVIARVTLGVIGTRTVSGEGTQYGTLNIGSEFTITTITKKMVKNGVFLQSFFNDGAAGTRARLDVAYVGLSYGSVGNLGLVDHPSADLYGAIQIANGFETISLKPRGSTGLPNSTLFEDTNNGLSFKDKNGVVKVIALV